MPPTSPQQDWLLESAQNVPREVVVWNWPLRDEPIKCGLVLIVVFLTIALVAGLTSSLAMILLASVGIAITLWQMWLPVKWELGLSGVSQSVLGYRRKVAWISIARYEMTSDGVWLFAKADRSPFHAAFIAYGNRQSEIQACVLYYLSAWTTNAQFSTEAFEAPSRTV